MKTASKIMLILGGALSLASILSFIIIGAVVIFQLTAPGSPFNEIITAIEKEFKEADPTLDPEIVRTMAVGVCVFGIAFGFGWTGLFSLISAILCFVASSGKKKGLYIAIIVFFALGSGQVCALLGSIFGLIAKNKEAKVVAAQ